MVTNKYASDYRLENVEKNGRLVTVPVYRGDWFRLLTDDEQTKKSKGLFLILTLLIAVFYLGALFLNTPCTRVMYVMLPFAAMCFPIFYMVTALVELLRYKGKSDRERKDIISTRFSSTSVICMVFSGGSFIGHIINWILNGEQTSDIVFLGFTAAVLVASIAVFSQKHRLVMEKITGI